MQVNRQRELETMMKQAGFSRLRTKRHTVWRHPTGAQLVTSQSPSDPNAIRAARRQLVKVCQQWGITVPHM